MTEERVDLPCPWCGGQVRHVVGCPSPPLDDPRWDARKKERAVIDHEYTDDITCPYCACEIEEPWEYDGAMTEDETRIECPECEKTFASFCHISYSFTTHPVDLERERRENEERRRAELERRAVARAKAAEFTPGTRVRVREDGPYADHISGREGSVANRELSSSGHVRVDLDPAGGRPGFQSTFDADELERI